MKLPTQDRCELYLERLAELHESASTQKERDALLVLAERVSEQRQRNQQREEVALDLVYRQMAKHLESPDQ